MIKAAHDAPDRFIPHRWAQKAAKRHKTVDFAHVHDEVNSRQDGGDGDIQVTDGYDGNMMMDFIPDTRDELGASGKGSKDSDHHIVHNGDFSGEMSGSQGAIDHRGDQTHQEHDELGTLSKLATPLSWVSILLLLLSMYIMLTHHFTSPIFLGPQSS